MSGLVLGDNRQRGKISRSRGLVRHAGRILTNIGTCCYMSFCLYVPCWALKLVNVNVSEG